MWNSNYIIKFELGTGIVKAANSPDTRNMFIKMFGNTPKDDAMLIIEGTGHVRNKLANIGITLPSVQFTDNSTLGLNEFICYWGIEKGHYSITHLNDLFDFIRNKALEYAKDETDMFQKALAAVGKDHNQQAYDAYRKLYYKARLKDDFYSSARALTEVSAIIACNNDLDFACQLASVAVQYAESYNIVDKNLKCQTYLNMASILKAYNHRMAIDYFMKCAQTAYQSDNSPFMFFALLGLAETHMLTGNVREAITSYEHSLALVKDTETTLTIQKKMICLYKNLVDQSKQIVADKEKKSEIRDILNSIVKDVCKNLCISAIFKVFNLQGGGAIISIGTKYLIERNIFNSPTVIGEKNIIN
ncbi:MAG: hypothetical protein Q4F85_13675 [Prevotella sp.]|nr:hypothetical protein [Prevotella sp.]